MISASHELKNAAQHVDNAARHAREEGLEIEDPPEDVDVQDVAEICDDLAETLRELAVNAEVLEDDA